MAKILFECEEADKALWIETARNERLSLSAWIRRVLAERVVPLASSGGGDLVREGEMTARSASTTFVGEEGVEEDPQLDGSFRTAGGDVPVGPRPDRSSSAASAEQPRMSAAEYQERTFRPDFKATSTEKPRRRR